MKEVHEAMEAVVRPMQECELKGFGVKTRQTVKWMSVLLAVSYCCNLPQGKNISAVQQGVAKRECPVNELW